MKRLLYLLLVLLMLQGMCMSAYATQSVSNERLRVMITEAIHGWKTELDLTGMGLHEDTVTAVVETICNDPELFWFNKYSWNLWRYPDTGITAKLEFQYYEEFKSSDVQVFEAAVDKALTCVLPGMDDLQKALVLHDYLASHVEYDYENYLNDTIPRPSYTAYGALVLGTAVCEGYAKAYCALLDRCGIENKYVSGYCATDRGEAGHGWTMIHLGDSWYHVDVTWDDPTPDGRVKHNYFLLSDSAISDEEHRHIKWYANNNCTSTQYDDAMIWTDVSTPIPFTDADTYWVLKEKGDYEDQKIQLVRGSWSSEDQEVVAAVWDYWPERKKSGWYWLNAYSGLTLWDYRLFFNDKQHIYAYDPADETFQKVFTYRDGGGYLYGLTSDGESIQYLIKQDADEESGKWHSVALEMKYPPGPFEDVVRGDYAFDAVQWAYDKGVAKGTDNDRFMPDTACNRAQVVTFLWRAAGRPAPKSSQNIFADVPDNAYYRDAVLWSVEQGITNGTGTDMKTGRQYFSPNANCTYSQILTFIWRWQTGRTASDHGTWYSEALEWAEKQDVLWKTASSADRVQTEKACPRRDVITYLWRVKASD